MQAAAVEKTGNERVNVNHAEEKLTMVREHTLKDERKKVVTSSDYISYKYYLAKNHVKDSMESYRAYHEQHCSIYQLMPPAMQEQQLKGTWNMRFC